MPKLLMRAFAAFVLLFAFAQVSGVASAQTVSVSASASNSLGGGGTTFSAVGSRIDLTFEVSDQRSFPIFTGLPSITITGAATTPALENFGCGPSVINRSGNQGSTALCRAQYAITSADFANNSVTISGAINYSVNGSAESQPFTPITLTRVSSPMGIATAFLNTATVGQPFSQQLEAGNATSPITWAVTGGSFPAGFSLSPSGLLTGSSAVQAFAVGIVITATDANAQSASRTYNFGVAGATPPNVEFVTPNSGPTTGGQTVRIFGSSFDTVTGVSFGGTPVTSFAVSNGGTQLTVTTPAHGAGAVDVVVTNPAGAATTAGGYTYIAAPAPAITFVSPQHGPAGGGTAITITGTNFTGATTVGLNGISIPFTVVNDTTITAVSPAGPEGQGVPAVVVTPTGTATLNNAFVYDFLPPTIISVTPASGPTAGGNSVVIRGTGFEVTAGPFPLFYYIVQIGGVNVTSFTVDSLTQITAVVPPHAAGTVNVSVQNERSINGIPTVLANGYTYGDYLIAPASLPAGTAGQAYSQQITTQGGTGASSFAVTAGALPPGMTLSASGLLGGTPTAGGTFNFSVTATDGTAPSPLTAVQAYQLTLGSPAITVGPATLPAGSQNAAYSQTLTASGGVGTYSFAVTAGALPAGLTLSAGGVLSGTPTTAGSFDFTVTATDSATGTGPFSGSRAYTVSVADTQPPVIVNLPANITVAADSSATGAVVSWEVPTATDNVAGVTISQTAGPAPGSTFPIGTTTITYTAVDVAGNRTAASFTVTVADNQVPTLTNLPANIVRPTDPGLPTAVVTWTPPTAADNIPGATVTQTAGPAPGSAFPIGVTTITYTASDAAGNQSSASFTVTVSDNEAPRIINLPANIVSEIFAPATSGPVNWAVPTVTDNAPGAVITQIAGPAPGSAFPAGTTTVTYRATDAAGNTSEASFSVTLTVVAVGTVTYKVETPVAGAFTFTSPEAALRTTINAAAGTTASPAFAVTPGTYAFAFTVPSGMGVTNVNCTGSGSSANALAKTGTVTVRAGQNVTCTITVVQSLVVTAEAIGDFMEARANLIQQNEPDLGRRLARVNGTEGAGGNSITAFGMPIGQNMPFAASVVQNHASFSYSLGSAGASASARAMRQAAVTGMTPAAASGPAPGMQSAAFAVPGSDPSGGAAAGSDPAPANMPDASRTRRFDLWIEGVIAKFSAGNGEGSFKVLHGGMDYLIKPGVLLGLGVQADRTDMDTRRGGEISGTGIMFGPYWTVRLSDRLYFDGRAAIGKSSNDVTPFGTYRDHFDAKRALVSAAMIGEFTAGDRFLIRPEGRVIWYRERSDAYVDRLGVAIPEIEVATGQFRFGPDLRWQLRQSGDVQITPHLKLDGIWTFDRKNTARRYTGGASDVFDTGLRARVEGGVGFVTRQSITTDFAMFYDGIGSGQYSSWGGRVQLHLSF